jgi:hypothetical protein
LGWNVLLGITNCAPQLQKDTGDKRKVYRFQQSRRNLGAEATLQARKHLQFRGASEGILFCTTCAAAQKNFFVDNIPEINHSQSLSPHTVQSASCAVDFFC